MAITDYHAKLYAYQLTQHFSSDKPEKLYSSLFDARVDLNPHQIEAALFAFKSPLSKGAILADEVGLGKTIEAGLIVSQKWAERKRKILIITPSSLRTQWKLELFEKFFIPCVILENKSFTEFIKNGNLNPFKQDNKVIITSYHFAKNKNDFIKQIRWDIVIIDEAHRLRNVYKKNNKIARTIKDAIKKAPKILLTATPLQNSLLELYGLVSFIDDYTFGDLKSFKENFIRDQSKESMEDLKTRLSSVCKRTLRRHVQEFIKYTNRIPMVQEFIPTPNEELLYKWLTNYLQKPILVALPTSQRNLLTLLMRKLLASSSFAIAGTLKILIERLDAMLSDPNYSINTKNILLDFADMTDFYEEWGYEVDELTQNSVLEQKITTKLIKDELRELRSCFDLAKSIRKNAKGEALLPALETGLKKAVELGAKEKAIIFTESRRTQEYLYRLLSKTKYAGKIVLYNGQNNSREAELIYQNWKKKYKASDKLTGSKNIDMKSALVDYFRENANIMIATEAASEGINLQFCSLVINYDLPWNPQRIEQRIGRCHRYGQKHDVVVINLLNKKNAADQRVYELLSEKFRLFSGIFGSSDEILGHLDSGIELEKRLIQIYLNCRTDEEIIASFDSLQTELEIEIDKKIKGTQKKLLDNFDQEVVEKFRIEFKNTEKSLNKYENKLWDITKYFLKKEAEFNPTNHSFLLYKNPFNNEKIKTGLYKIGKLSDRGYTYRIGHPLAINIINFFKEKLLNSAEITFNYSRFIGRITPIEELKGKTGTLIAKNIKFKSLNTEDNIVLCGLRDDGLLLSEEQCFQLFQLSGRIKKKNVIIDESKKINRIIEKKKNKILDSIKEKNILFFEQEINKLEKWTEDRKKNLEKKLTEYDSIISEFRKKSKLTYDLKEKIDLEKEIKTLEMKRDTAWKEYDKGTQDIYLQKEALLQETEKLLEIHIFMEDIFSIKWKVI